MKFDVRFSITAKPFDKYVDEKIDKPTLQEAFAVLMQKAEELSPGCGSRLAYLSVNFGCADGFPLGAGAMSVVVHPAEEEKDLCKEVDEQEWRLVMHNTDEVPERILVLPAGKLSGADAVAQFESGMQATLVARAEEDLGSLVDMLRTAGAPVARILRLIHEQSQHYLDQLASFMPGTRMLPRRLGGYQTAGPLPSYNLVPGSSGALDPDEGTTLASAGGLPDQETFGAQMLQQVLATHKQSSRPKEIRDLTAALADAKEAELDQDVIAPLKARLQKLLADENPALAGAALQAPPSAAGGRDAALVFSDVLG